MAVSEAFPVSGGLNTKASIFTLPKNQLMQCQNMFIQHGMLHNRYGADNLLASALSEVAIVGFFTWTFQNAGSSQDFLIIMAWDNSTTEKVYKMEDMDGTADDITGAATLTFTNTRQVSADSLNNIFAFVSATMAVHKFTGSGNIAVLAGSPPVSSMIVVVNNFMFLANHWIGFTSNPSRVNWSNVSDPETWGASDFVDYRDGDGTAVRALAGFQNDLIIFKDRHIGRLSTTPPSSDASVTLGPLITINENLGCAGANAVDQLDDGRLVFLGSDAHMYIYNGATFTDISDQPYPQPSVQPSFDNFGGSHVVSTGSLLETANVKYYPARKQVWVNVPDSGSSDPAMDNIFIYHLQENAWTQYVGQKAQFLNRVKDIRTTADQQFPYMMMTGNDSGHLFFQDDTGQFVNDEDPADPIAFEQIIEKSFLLTQDISFQPASILFTTILFNSTLGFTRTVKGDGETITQLGVITAQIGSSKNSLKMETMGRYLSLQVELKPNAGGTTNEYLHGPMYLSDQIEVDGRGA